MDQVGQEQHPTPEGQPFPAMPEISVTKEGVFKLLLKLNPNKATGPDLLPARILKDMANEIAPILTAIFQRSFDTGIVPRDWRTANVTAIFKKGEKYKPANYRPVSLTSLCCKIQEHIVTSNVLNHLDEHHILTDCQHGFRARRSCETQLLTLAQELIAGLDKRHQHDTLNHLFRPFRALIVKCDGQRVQHRCRCRIYCCYLST